MARRPILDPNTWGSDATFTGPVGNAIVGTPTKIAPTVGLETQGYNPQDATAQPTAQELNYKLNSLDKFTKYLDAIEAANFGALNVPAISGNVNGAQTCSGLCWDPTNGCYWCIGDNLDSSGFPGTAVLRSHDGMRNWSTSMSTSRPTMTSQPLAYTGGFAASKTGDWMALACSGPFGVGTVIQSLLLVSHVASAGVLAASIVTGSLPFWSSSNMVYHSCIDYSDALGMFLVGGHAGNGLDQPGIWLVSADQTTLTLLPMPTPGPSASSTNIVQIACGDTYILAVDNLGYMYRASVANISAGFVLVSPFISRQSCASMIWLPEDKTFFASQWSTGSPFPSGLSFWTSTDGSIWSLTTPTVGAAFATNFPDIDGSVTGYVPRPVCAHGSVIHALVQVPVITGSTVSRHWHAVSTDIGATWKIYPIGVDDPGTIALPSRCTTHAPRGEERVHITVGTAQLAGATTCEIAAGLRLRSH